ncbi:hypothetical protein FB451DRAFT_1255329 [Mycena latifolia]|nr:hypothetical protein FB451DRAFT_1255329 [Mycena latifolia]
MAGYESCSAVFGTAELRGHIVDFLHDSNEDLKSCALVARAFTFLAQGHLFNRVELTRASGFLADLFHPNNDGSATRLREIMEEAPHLRPLVRQVYVMMDLDILTQLEKMHLTHVKYLTLVNSQSVSIPALGVARHLLALPSLSTLFIDSLFPDLAGLKFLFERCTPTLRTLHLHYIGFSSASEVSEPPVATAVSPRVPLTHLRLLQTSPAIAEWFLDPMCPFDFSHLQDVDIYNTVSPALVEVLEAARATLNVLYIHARIVPAGISLASFPALKKLRLVGIPSDLATALTMFPPALYGLEQLLLASTLFHANSPPNDALQRIDLLLSRLHVPALIRVEVSILHVLTGSSAPASVDDIESVCTAVTGAFKHMHERGVLVVRDYREWERA